MLDTGRYAFWRGSLADRTYCRDLQLLTAKLFSRVDDIEFGSLVPLDDALARLDGEHAKAGLTPAGDMQFDVARPSGPVEYTNRLYLGRDDCYCVLWASRDVLDAFYYSARADGSWVITGTVGASVAKQISLKAGLDVQHFPLRIHAGLAHHQAHLQTSGAAMKPAPRTFEEAVAAYARYLEVALH